MDKGTKVRWMATFSTASEERPAWLPSDAVLIRLDTGPAVLPPSVPEQVSADELNQWPGETSPTAQPAVIPSPDCGAACPERRERENGICNTIT